MEREGGMSSINFHLEEQGQEGRSCQYSAILVAGSCTIFYDVTFYVTYLQHELHQNLGPVFAMGFFCWTTCKVRDCLRLSSLTHHLCKHYGGWSGISLGVAVKSVQVSTLHCERSLHDGKDKIIRTSLRKRRQTMVEGVSFHSLEHSPLGSRSAIRRCIEWLHGLWQRSGLLWCHALYNVLCRSAFSKWKICWQSKC
jgi:hypothetical protein